MKSFLKDDLLGLKEKLENLEKELENVKDIPCKEQAVKNLEEKMNEYILLKDDIIILNVGGKKFQTNKSTLLKIKNSLFAQILEKDENSKELFFDRGYQHFKTILDYLRSGNISLKQFNRYDREDIINELEYYGLSENLNLSKKAMIDIGWDQNASKQGACSVNLDDNKILKIHSNTCYTHFLTNRTFTNESFVIELFSTVRQTDNYYYIGLINESYSTSGSCMCCNPANSFYIQCDGSIHINCQRHNQNNMAWHSLEVTIGMKINLRERKIWFYIPDKEECGPYNINGNSFRVVAGHCNNGNGELTILDCYEMDL